MTASKTLVTLIAISAFSSPLYAQRHDHKSMANMQVAPPSVSANAAALSGPGAVVKVNGLICDFCVQSLTKTFKKQAAVRAVAIDLTAKEVRIGFKSGMSLDDATIRKLIKDAGYNVVSIARRAA